MRRTHATIFIASAVLMLTGCGVPGNDVPGNDNSTSAAAPAAGWSATDACALLPKDKVASAFGATVSETQLSMVTPGTAETAAFSQCTYSFDAGAMVTFFARQSPVPDNTAEAIARTKQGLIDNLGATIEPVTGLGKDAFWTDNMNQLHVFAGEDRYFFFTSSKPPAGSKPRDAMTALAKTFVS